MLDGTRSVQIYIRAQGPQEPRFGHEIDDDAVNDYAYHGWLPLKLSPRDENGRQHATLIGDAWLTTPVCGKTPSEHGAGPLEPGPPPVRITADECSAELDERARVGLRYFLEETPDEQGRPYDRNCIAQDIAEATRDTGARLAKDVATHGALGHPAVSRVSVSIANLDRILITGQSDPPPLGETCHEAVNDFVSTHHRELVQHIEQRIRESRNRLRGLTYAAERLRAFDD